MVNTFAKYAIFIVSISFGASAPALPHIRPGVPPRAAENMVLRIHTHIAPTLPNSTMSEIPSAALNLGVKTQTYGQTIASASSILPYQIFPGLSLETGNQPLGVVAADLNADGAADLIIANTISGNVSVLLGDGNGTFHNQIRYAASPYAQSAIVADFNGDGRLDIATANYIFDSISVLLGNGDGTFQKAMTYDVGSTVDQIISADINGDGIPDIIASSGSSIIELTGDGHGSFVKAGTYSLASALQIAMCDVNNDGDPDIVALDQTDSLVEVRLGNGNGTFQNAESYATGIYPWGLACADFNGDGAADIAVTGTTVTSTGQSTPYLETFLGQTDGTLMGPSTQQLGYPPGAPHIPYDPVVGDMNGDGIPDLVVAYVSPVTSTNVIQIFKGNGDGSFTAGASYFAGTGMGGYILADLNGDDKLDVAITNMTDDSVVTLFGRGDGTLQGQRVFGVNGGPTTLALGDLNHDGIKDIVTADQTTATISVLLGGAGATFRPSQDYYIGGPNDFWLWGVTIADFDGDGNPDVAASIEGNNEVGILFGKGDGTLGNTQTYPVGTQPLGIVAADLNGDGAPDIVTADSGSADISVLLNNGNGTFQSRTAYSTGAYPSALAVSDLNGDGYPDIAVTDYYSNSVSVFLGNGDGTFQPQKTYPVGTNPWDVAVGDFNKDGYPDLAVTNSCSDPSTATVCDYSVGILLGNGDGSFQAQKTYPTGAPPTGITVSDLNDDGNPDLVVTNDYYGLNPGYPFDTVGIFLGNGDGTFGNQLTYASGYIPYDVKSADLNGDGWPDIIVANNASKNVTVMPHLQPTPEITKTHFNALLNQTLDGQLSANDPFSLPTSFSLVSSPVSGKVSLTSSGGFAYTPPTGFLGLDSFVASVSDGKASSQFRIYVTVKPPAPTISAPAAMTIQEATFAASTQGGPESFTVGGTGTLTISVASSDIGLIADNDIDVTPATGPTGTRQITVHPEPNLIGKAVITLTAKDAYEQSTSTSFQVTVYAPKSSSSSGSSGGGSFDLYCLLGLLGTFVWFVGLRRNSA